MTWRLRFGFIVLLALNTILPANATWVEVQWEGVVVTPGFVSDVSAGDAITGSFSYALGVPATDTGFPEFKEYYRANTWNRFAVGGYEGVFFHQALGVFDNFFTAGDQFDTRKGILVPSPEYQGDVINGVVPLSMNWRIVDPTGTALGDTALPLSLNAADWALNSSYLSVLKGVGAPDLEFWVSGFSASVIPAPSVLLLMLLGLVGLVGISKGTSVQ